MRIVPRVSVLALVAAAAVAHAAGGARALSLEQALAAARKTPAAQAAAGEARAAEERVPSASAWPGTTLSLGTTRKTARLIAGISLPLPIFGDLAPARAQAEAERDRARADASLAGLTLEHDVTVAWIELARLEARAELADDGAARAAELKTVADKRLEHGDASKAEAELAGAAAARARADAAAAHGQVSAASAELAGLIGADPDLPLHADGGLPARPGALPGLAALRARAASHPDVTAADADVAAGAAGVSQAERARWPHLSLDAEADVSDPTLPGTDVRVGLSLEIPLFGRTTPALRAARTARDAARRRREAALARVDAAIVAAYRRYQAALGRLDTLETEVAPAQREAARYARLAYQEGQGDLTQVLQAERSLLEVEAELVDARADAAIATADLRLAAGGAW
jgi:cobalt-zinc-cadmium efflux system outer membrane protein